MNMKILVVEDDLELQAFLKKGLEAEMFAIDTVTDGEEASYLARTNTYDLIILDNMLPNKDGRTICEEIRHDQKTTPILVLSALQDTDQKTGLLNAGADDYLTKPFELAELLARVRALLRRPQTMQDEVLEMRDITLDALSNTVYRDGVEITLTRKEFMLLQYLMRNPDSVLTRAMILEHVWDMSVDIFSNTIESHILSLRKKLGDTDKENKIIKTVPGRGYKIVSS